MHFCVIGDSWGGNFECNLGVFEETLSAHGHTVDNISSGGSSNQGQLRKLEYNYLETNTPDYIIWIYSEPVRDFTEFVSLRFGDDANAVKDTYPNLTYTEFYQDLTYLATQDFRHAQRLYDAYKVPFIVVGAAGQVDRSIDNFTFSALTIHNWSQEIAKLEHMPVNCYLDHVLWMCEWKNTYNRQEVLEEISLLQSLEHVMLTDAQRYPDGHHAAREFYPPLIERILTNIKEQQ